MKVLLLEKMKWMSIKFKSSIYPICAVALTISFSAIVIICCIFDSTSIVYGLGTSVFTGVIASIIVSIIIQKKQDKEQFEKKRAILFDAAFYLKKFEEEYKGKKKINSNLDENWEQLFELCVEPANYLSKLYKNGLDVLDVVDISILRRINSNYRFLMGMSKIINLHAKDKKFLKNTTEIMEVRNKYDEAIKELKENLFYLFIKWEKDRLID